MCAKTGINLWSIILFAAGVKVAVANAIEELKQRADIVLPHSNDEDAVARYLQENIGL